MKIAAYFVDGAVRHVYCTTGSMDEDPMQRIDPGIPATVRVGVLSGDEFLSPLTVLKALQADPERTEIEGRALAWNQ